MQRAANISEPPFPLCPCCLSAPYCQTPILWAEGGTDNEALDSQLRNPRQQASLQFHEVSHEENRGPLCQKLGIKV